MRQSTIVSFKFKPTFKSKETPFTFVRRRRFIRHRFKKILVNLPKIAEALENADQWDMKYQFSEITTKLNFNENELSTLYIYFKYYEKNGTVEAKQFRQLMRILVPWWTDHVTSVERLFVVLDRNEDGLLNFNEFLNGLYVFIRGPMDKRIQLFYEMQAGIIDKDIFFNILETLYCYFVPEEFEQNGHIKPIDDWLNLYCGDDRQSLDAFRAAILQFPIFDQYFRGNLYATIPYTYTKGKRKSTPNNLDQDSQAMAYLAKIKNLPAPKKKRHSLDSQTDETPAAGTATAAKAANPKVPTRNIPKVSNDIRTASSPGLIENNSNNKKRLTSTENLYQETAAPNPKPNPKRVTSPNILLVTPPKDNKKKSTNNSDDFDFDKFVPPNIDDPVLVDEQKKK